LSSRPPTTRSAPQVTEDWLVANCVTTGLAELLAKLGDPEAAAFIVGTRSDGTTNTWIGDLVKARSTDTSIAALVCDPTYPGNHEGLLVFILAAATFESEGVVGWQSIRKTHARSIQRPSPQMKKTATAILAEVSGLPTGHPALEVLGVFAN